MSSRVKCKHFFFLPTLKFVALEKKRGINVQNENENVIKCPNGKCRQHFTRYELLLLEKKSVHYIPLFTE